MCACVNSTLESTCQCVFPSRYTLSREFPPSCRDLAPQTLTLGAHIVKNAANIAYTINYT